MLDDIYQYHLPPTRRVPPLLWTRLRGDLPGYLADSEADGVIVINWYHRQFRSMAVTIWNVRDNNGIYDCREAAKMRYLSQENQFQYFHDIMSEYFLGTYGGGRPKPFKYTEIQRHRCGCGERGCWCLR